MPRELPPLSHLQFLALGVILSSDEPGRVIRDVVADYGVRRTGAAFYQLMARLERDGLTEGWYEPVIVGDQAVRERRYRITGAGSRAWRQTRSSTRPSPPRPRRAGCPMPDPRIARASARCSHGASWPTPSSRHGKTCASPT